MQRRFHTFMGLALTIALINALSGTAFAQCANPPGPNQITIWQERDFAGPCKTLEIGSYPNSSFLSPVGNDSISSLKVGSNVRAHLFEHKDYDGHVALYEGGSAHNGNGNGPDQLGPNVADETTSIIVAPDYGVRV